MLTFSDNSAKQGGAIVFKDNHIILKGNTTVVFVNNGAVDRGGAVTFYFSNITINENCTLHFNGNHAEYGGAMYDDSSTSTIIGPARVTFSNNI